jgi:CBS domain-containing protein
MALNFSLIEAFVAEYQDIMKDKTLLRQDRYRILTELSDKLQSSLKDYRAFEHELTSLILHRIESSESYDELMECHRRAVAGVANFYLEEDSIVDVHDLFRIVRDSLASKVLKLVEKEMEEEGHGPPPGSYAWAGLGSEGRDEQTLMTDQDNLIIYEEASEDSSAARYYELFARKAADRLDNVGFEKCKGDVMPSNPKWRGTLQDWKARLEARMVYDNGIFEFLDVIILTDARYVSGRKELLLGLTDYFFGRLLDNKHLMKDFIESAVLMPTALTFFGNFKTEKSGENAGKLNIKLLGWAPLIFSVRMACLVNGIFETNTLKRIGLLGDRKIIKKDMEMDLTEAYLVFVKFRLVNQINRMENGGLQRNFVEPGMLGGEGEERLHKAMKTVEAFQKYMQETQLFGQAM